MPIDANPIKLNQKGRNLMTTYDDFNLDLQHATSTQSDDERLLTADAVCAATWAVCVPVSENFCSPGNICDLTDECTVRVEPFQMHTLTVVPLADNSSFTVVDSL